MKNPHRHEGCVLYRRLIHQGYAMPKLCQDSTTSRAWFGSAVNILATQGIPAVLDPVCRIDAKEVMRDWTDIRPPFSELWVETVTPDMHVGALILTDKQQSPAGKIRLCFFVYGQNFAAAHPCALAAVYVWIEPETGDADGFSPAPAVMFEDPNEDAYFQQCVLYPITRTLQLLNASNVGLYKVDHDRATRKHLKRIKAPEAATTYHVLVLKDAQPRSPKDEIQNPGIMPLHVAKGHWSHYGPRYGKGLLFGKIEGKFWVPEAEKGKALNGIRHKHYTVGKSDNANPHAQAVAAAVNATPASPSEAADGVKVFDPTYTDQPVPKTQESAK